MFSPAAGRHRPGVRGLGMLCTEGPDWMDSVETVSNQHSPEGRGWGKGTF